MTDSRFDNNHDHTNELMELREIRGLVGPTALPALFLIYYGFSGGWTPSVATTILEYTCKIGGIALAISVLVLLSGRLFALLFNGIVSIPTGLGLVIGGVMWFNQNKGLDLTTIVEIVFGFILLNGGWSCISSYRRYAAITGTLNESRDPAGEISTTTQRAIESASSTPPASFSASETSDVVEKPAEPEIEPPEGYLASFARPKESRPDND